MAVVRVELADSIYEYAKELSSKDKVSLNQFIATAVAEKISALDMQSYLEQGAQRGTKEKFLKALDRVSNEEPEDYDKL